MNLGVTKKVIYHNVGDKETLIAECYRRSFRLYDAITKQVEALGSPRLGAIISSTSTFAAAHLREDIAPLAPISGIEALPVGVQDEINITSIGIMNSFLSFYNQGQVDGSIRPLNARAILAINPGSFEWLLKWYDALSDDERAIAPQELARLNHIGLLAL